MDFATFYKVDLITCTLETKQRLRKHPKNLLENHLISTWQNGDFSFASTLISHFSLQDSISALGPELSLTLKLPLNPGDYGGIQKYFTPKNVVLSMNPKPLHFFLLC